jgi:PhnB protein
VHIQTYLYFDGRCEEALEFYGRVLGAEIVTLMRFKDSTVPPDPELCPPEVNIDDKVMHVSFRIGDTNLMASDGRCAGRPDFRGFSLTITAQDEAEADRLFTALGEGGQVLMPMTSTFFASRFGIVADRFGVSWMILAAP